MLNNFSIFQLCEKHFRSDQVKKNNNKAELVPGSVPSILKTSEDCEEIISNNSTSTGRENVFTKVLKSDQQQFEIGVVESVTTYNEYQKKHFFSSF